MSRRHLRQLSPSRFFCFRLRRFAMFHYFRLACCPAAELRASASRHAVSLMPITPYFSRYTLLFFLLVDRYFDFSDAFSA
jgi:hypothetical protein